MFFVLSPLRPVIVFFRVEVFAKPLYKASKIEMKFFKIKLFIKELYLCLDNVAQTNNLASWAISLGIRNTSNFYETTEQNYKIFLRIPNFYGEI